MFISESASVSGLSTIGSIGYAAGASGDIEIRAGELNLDTEFSSITSGSAGIASAGQITIDVEGDVNIFDGAFISTATSRPERGGLLSVSSSNLNIESGGKLFTSSLDSQNADLSQIAPILEALLSESGLGEFDSQAASESSGASNSLGMSGDISVNVTESLNINNGLLSSRSDGQASGGDIKIVANRTAISGTGLLASSALGEGDAGDISVVGVSLRLTGSGSISRENEGRGDAGSIDLEFADSINLDQGSIRAVSRSDGGGNINLSAAETSLLNGSLISSSVVSGDGGGGNISIDSPLFVALQNSDVLANADSGSGGEILINSPAFLIDLFSTEKARPVGKNPGEFNTFRSNSTSDISADFSPTEIPQTSPPQDSVPFDLLRDNAQTDISAQSRTGPDGSTSYSRVAPERRFGEAIAGLADNADRIDRSCRPSGANFRSEFYISGKSGLPLSPNEPQDMTSASLPPWLPLVVPADQTASASAPPLPELPDQSAPVEAQTWIKSPSGAVQLVQGRSLPKTAIACPTHSDQPKA